MVSGRKQQSDDLLIQSYKTIQIKLSVSDLLIHVYLKNFIRIVISFKFE